GLKDSEELSVELLKSYVNTTGIGFPKVSYSPVPAQQYNGLGRGILMDGYLGTSNFRDGRWMGFEGSVILTVDLGGIRTIKSVGVSMLRSPIAWIMLPEKVVVSASVDNRDFVPFSTLPNSMNRNDIRIAKYRFWQSGLYLKTRYVRFQINALSGLPEWHPGAGSQPWTFIDEVIIEKP
ncbi:MAG: discoidin domain-containing protein, partial [Bacteroidota bacterium]|nr:discoidin domain-containing protein [Bacteroidota bacterium]